MNIDEQNNKMQSSDGFPLNLDSQLTFQQTIIEPEINLTHIQSNHYFMLINKKANKALTYKETHNYYKQHAQLMDIDQNDIRQIFLIQQIQTDKYQIVHGPSTLVFTRKDNQVMLDFGNWKDSQFFYTQKISASNNKLEYWIKENKKSNKFLFFDGSALRCQPIFPDDESAVWEIKLCLHNKALNRTCWIEYVFSNQVIDIPGASEQEGKQLIQYPCNYRFNQRFFIEEYRQESSQTNITSDSPQTNSQRLFTIQSLKTRQFITVNSGAFSTSVVQEHKKKKKVSLKQLWKIQYFGNGLYIIKSALKPNMYLVVKDRSAKNEQALVIGQNQNECLWKIIGNFNITPNKDFKF